MATGKLAGTSMSAATDTQIYTCPAGNFAVVTVSMCNRNATAVTLRLAVGDTFPPGNSDYLEFDTSVLANGVLERTGIVLAAGQIISARSSGTGVSTLVYGIETPTV
jgi:hypothetical protein